MISRLMNSQNPKDFLKIQGNDLGFTASQSDFPPLAGLPRTGNHPDRPTELPAQWMDALFPSRTRARLDIAYIDAIYKNQFILNKFKCLHSLTG